MWQQLPSSNVYQWVTYSMKIILIILFLSKMYTELLKTNIYIVILTLTMKCSISRTWVYWHIMLNCMWIVKMAKRIIKIISISGKTKKVGQTFTIINVSIQSEPYILNLTVDFVQFWPFVAYQDIIIHYKFLVHMYMSVYINFSIGCITSNIRAAHCNKNG